MIVLYELLGHGIEFDDLDSETQSNLMELLNRINKVREAWGKPMFVTSGYRTLAHHLEIYAAKGITDIKRIPMKSNHLFGRAVDISDRNREMQKWCIDNEQLLATIGLWMESFNATATWVHFQINPPDSGKRWFNP